MKEELTTTNQKEEPPGATDPRLKLAELITFAPESRVSAIMELYPEYFPIKTGVGALERTSDLNTSFLKWKEDYGITKDWIIEFPTNDIYYNYVRYCIENRFNSMDKSLFYHTLEMDFNLISA